MLYIVPTPIGNLGDMTFRAIEVLRNVDRIYAEDTRVTAKLLTHFEIENSLDSFHIQNEHKKLASIISELKSGQNIALVSDAGTPGISDPGFMLVREAISNEIEVSCLPGPTALIPALVMSGLPSDKFYFEGFLPHKKGKQTRLKYLLELEVTTVFYESPYRILKTLKQISDLGGGERLVVLSREISKLYEENIRGSVDELVSEMESRDAIKGEFVVCMSGKSLS